MPENARKLKAAEAARVAAETQAQGDRFARIAAEKARDKTLDDLREANESPSRLERLLDKHIARDCG
jgi:hypothetical protein